MATLTEKREKRGTAVRNAQSILEKAKAEKRDMSAEESKKFDDFMSESDTIKAEIDSIEGHEARTKRLAEAAKELETRGERKTETEPGETGGGNHEERAIRWKVSGGEEREVVLQGARGTDQYRKAFRTFLASGNAAGLQVRNEGEREARDLAADDDVAGGYLAAPLQMVAGLIKAVDDITQIRQYATVMQLRSAQSLGVPSLDTDPSDADWTSEVKTGSADTAMAFGRRELNPSPLAKRIKISRKLARLAPNIESLVMQRLAYKFGITEEKAFLTGSGAGQPLGLFTASANGVSTSRDVTIGSTTAITADGLIDTKFFLKPQYWGLARWLMHRDALKQIRKLKDSTNQYLWVPGLTAGEPDQILNSPYLLSEYAPNTFTTGLYTAIYGDLSKYWIAEALSMEVQRLDQLYAETNQIGYIGRMEVDGMPVLGEAFARGKLA